MSELRQVKFWYDQLSLGEVPDSTVKGWYHHTSGDHALVEDCQGRLWWIPHTRMRFMHPPDEPIEEFSFTTELKGVKNPEQEYAPAYKIVSADEFAHRSIKIGGSRLSVHQVAILLFITRVGEPPFTLERIAKGALSRFPDFDSLDKTVAEYRRWAYSKCESLRDKGLLKLGKESLLPGTYHYEATSKGEVFVAGYFDKLDKLATCFEPA